MAGIRFTDLQSRPMEFLDFTSLTLDEFQQLVSPFETAFHTRMAAWRMDGKPRTARRWYSPGSTLKKKKGQTSDQCGAHHHSIGGLVHAKTSGLGPTVSQPRLFSLSADQPWQR
jgi:hypothetical protein